MTPYYSHAGITIYHGNNRDVLPTLEGVDLLLTDPPYGIGIAANPFRQKFARSDWDATPADAGVLIACVLKAKASIVWGGNYFGLPPHQKFLVWDKEQPEDFSSAMCEQAWTNIEGPAKLWRQRVVGYVKEHPTQKPLELMIWCIRQSKKANTILDPFLGSGTTLVAAKMLGRRAIGIEIEERYCEIAAKRLQQEVLPMGGDVEPEPSQLSLVV